jgi:hypothetical protein
MSPTLLHHRQKLAATFVFLCVALTVSSCGRTQAASPADSIDTVMKTIHDYGRGHQGVISLGPTSVPEETDEQYAATITNYFLRGEFAELEKIARQNRMEKGRVKGGLWKSSSFFTAIADPHGEKIDDSDYDVRISTAKKWAAAYPSSATARIALADIYSDYAGSARGSGHASSVSDANWKLFYSRVALAKQVLLEAAPMKDKDAHWFDVMMQVSHNEGWDRARERELFDQAVAFEPSYYHFYRRYANYLLPQWYGEDGDVQAFADEIAAHRSEPESSIFYFEIVSTLTCYCTTGMDALRLTSWPRTKEGYADMKRLYGTSNLKANRFAFLAMVANDKSAAHEAFTSITEPLLDIWTSEEVFNNARAWADAQ